MIEEELFMKVIETLKFNNDCVICGVADKGADEFRVFYSGKDELIVKLMDGMQEVYLQDLMRDLNKSKKSTEAMEQAMNDIDWEKLLNDWLEDGNGEN
jgi:hypothetical protein